MHDLTARQVQILKSLIEEYINTADAVGSETLEKKHSVSASPATIRNEMVRLEELGYLKKPHTSAGRVPTSSAMKFYVNQLMKEKELSVAEEVAVKEKVWDYREKEKEFLRLVTKALAEKTHTLAVAMTNKGDIITAGYANLFNMPEFFEIDTTRNLFEALEDFGSFMDVLNQAQVAEDICVLLGEELGPSLQGPYGSVFTRFHTPLQTIGEIGVLGPTRLNYTAIIPTVRYFGNLIEEIAKGW